MKAKTKRIDAATKRWIRNVSDERAAANGCRFDEERGQFVVDWIERYCRLYEGEWAGQPMTLSDWQPDFVMRLFGWIKYSDRWKRWIRRFREASVWIPKKNKKSPTLAALGLYLLCGDNEPGQKCYFGAKDGTQAREIAGKHAIEMVQASPELMSECKINRTSFEIAHVPSRSILKPLSSSDSKAQKAKEGLNGSLLIDEVHVVDDEFMGRVSRAGISRSEPLMIQVSTAGDDPESYGYKRYEYGKRVLAGDETDESLLVVCYEAPQDLTDAELARDPVKYGKLANPAWGHTIGEEEFVADYNRSKDRPVELSRFKMYRLNIWARVAEAFIRADAWAKCRDDYDASDLRGEECFAGLDLAKTTDMTSLVLVFRVGEEFRVVPYFWMPEEGVRLGPREYLRRWAAEGHLRTTPGSVCDYERIKADIIELHEAFGFSSIAYDPWNAEHLTQQLEFESGIERVEFKQTMANFAEPTGEFERLVSGGSLRHNGHPILTWQAGHVKVHCDGSGNKRPIKPKHGDPRKIDGIVAAIMGLSLFTRGEAQGGGGITEGIWSRD